VAYAEFSKRAGAKPNFVEEREMELKKTEEGVD